MNENNRRLSRTHGGESDTSASHEKLPLLLTGDALRRQSAENERRVCQLIMDWRTEPLLTDWAVIRQVLFVMADLTNTGLLPAGRLRVWDVPYPVQPAEDDGYQPAPSRRIPADEMPQAVETFCRTIHARLHELAADPVALAAWAAWHINPGPLHPFYDGCGRVSRTFSAWLLARASRFPPLFEDWSTYFTHAAGGPAVFADYMRARIEACEAWVAGSG